MEAAVIAIAAVLYLAQKETTVTPARTIIDRIAEAIATAEGFFVAGSRPQRNNNPGNLTLDIPGGGRGVGRDGIYVVYFSAADGWADLKAQVRMMLDNTSRIYSRDMRIIDVARKYTTTQQDHWARNVATKLGVSIETRLSEIT